VLFVLTLLLVVPSTTVQAQGPDETTPEARTRLADGESTRPVVTAKVAKDSGRYKALMVGLTIFMLALFVGMEVIAKVPPTLHTPLMSGSNAISGITVVGAIIAAGSAWNATHSSGETDSWRFIATLAGLAAVALAMINVAGGFWVTHRMLGMFRGKSE